MTSVVKASSATVERTDGSAGPRVDARRETGRLSTCASGDGAVVVRVDDLVIALRSRPLRRTRDSDQSGSGVTADGEGTILVHGVDVELRRGQTLCVVGESGSGKSLTALALMGLLPNAFARPRGTATLAGQAGELDLLDPAVVSRVRGLRLGMIFQEPMTSLNPVQPIGEQIEEVLRLHRPDVGAAARATAVREWLARVQLPEPDRIAASFPHQLSGGQRQRAMIAMALIGEPDVLIADEPTTALDVTVQAEILRLIDALKAERGMAVMLITHDFGVVAHHADHVAVMRLGRIVERGPRERVLRRPEHAYTRSLIAALPENLPPRRRRAPGDRLIEARGLSVHFPVYKGLLRRQVDVVRALDGVDLDLHAGEVLAVIGESGSGKTTLGRALLGLERVTAGQLKLFGEDMTGAKPRVWRSLRRRIQVVFQDPQSSLNPRLPIGELLTEPMAVHGIGADHEDRERLAAEALAAVGLPAGSLERFAHEFSGGQRQRIGIAKALVLDPEVIVCDEITSALDVSVQAEILRILERLIVERGIALVFITHNMGVVEALADRVLVMLQGRVVEAGSVDGVIKHPRESYTQKLLAAVPRLTPLNVAD
ncbi:MAG: ABC transporter ATP-binding protein [Thioalkalivibrionaceae bacterium]